MTKKHPLTREDKERKIIELTEKGTNIRDISKLVHMSFTDIGQITRRHSGDEHNTQKSTKLSKHSQALELFHNGESILRVAINLGLNDSEAMEEQKQYQRLIANDRFCDIYDAMSNDLESHLSLHAELTNANLTAKDAIEGITYARQLKLMRMEHGWLQNDLPQLRQAALHAKIELEGLKQKKIFLINEIEKLKETREPYLIERNPYVQPNPEGTSSMGIRRMRIRRRRSLEAFKD
jgi:hypothetical protein